VFFGFADEGSEQRGSSKVGLEKQMIPAMYAMRELSRSLQRSKEKSHGIGCSK
jgi:hypothetical protein